MIGAANRLAAFSATKNEELRRVRATFFISSHIEVTIVSLTKLQLQSCALSVYASLLLITTTINC